MQKLCEMSVPLLCTSHRAQAFPSNSYHLKILNQQLEGWLFGGFEIESGGQRKTGRDQRFCLSFGRVCMVCGVVYVFICVFTTEYLYTVVLLFLVAASVGGMLSVFCLYGLLVGV